MQLLASYRNKKLAFITGLIPLPRRILIVVFCEVGHYQLKLLRILESFDWLNDFEIFVKEQSEMGSMGALLF